MAKQISGEIALQVAGTASAKALRPEAWDRVCLIYVGNSKQGRVGM